MFFRPRKALVRSASVGFVWALTATLLHAQGGVTTVGLNPENGTPEFSTSFGGQLGSYQWDTGDLLITTFGTEANPITATIGAITGGEMEQVIPPIYYPPPIDDQLFFEGVTADTRSGLEINAELYGRAGIVAGASLEFGGVSGHLDFNTNPVVEIPQQIRAGRFFHVNGIGPQLTSNSSLDITAPGVDFDVDLILDIDARGTVEYGLYPFAGYTIGDFHLPDIFIDIDLCRDILSFPGNLLNPDFNVCEGDPNHDALLKLPINLPRPKTPPGLPDPPVIQVGEFQLVNPIAALETTTTVDAATNKLTINGNTDLVRLAADIDGIIGGATVGTSELSGGSRNLPSDENPIVELSYDLIDIKYGPEFGYDFNASVVNKLNVTLDFSDSVLIGTDPIPDNTWQGPWDEIPQIALLSASPVNVNVNFTGFETDLLYESRFTLADYLEMKALELRLALNFERLGLGPVATAALKKALKIPPLGPLLYDKKSLLGKAEFDDLPAIELNDLIDIDLTTGLNENLWDGSFTLAPEPIEEVFLVGGNPSLNDASNYRKFSAPLSSPTASELANSVVVLGNYSDTEPGSRLDATPVNYLDVVGGVLAVQGLHVPAGTLFRLSPGVNRTFTGTDLLTIENDGEMAAGFNGTTGNLLRFTLNNANVPLFITGDGRIQFTGNDAAAEISAQQVIHDAGHQLSFIDDPSVQAAQSISASTSMFNLGMIEASSDLSITTAQLTNGATGEILAYDNGDIELENLVENSGVVRSIGNSRITINAGQFTPTINGPTEGDAGVFQAAQGGQIRFAGGNSRPLAGRLDIEATSGGAVTFEKRITVAQDSVVNLVVQQGSSMTLNGLGLASCIGCNEDAKAVITNHGLLELASGKNSLRVPSGLLTDVDDVIVPIDLVNTGTIRVLESAELLFDFAIENYSGNGTTFAGGTWELIGNPETFDNRTPPPNPAFFETTPDTWAFLDMQVGEVPRDAELIEVELPLDELTTALKFNAADVLLSGAALFPYFNTVEVNLGTIRLEQMQQFHTAGALENRDGQMQVASGAGLIVHGPLTINGGTVSVVDAGSKLEVVGGSFEQEDGSLGRRDIEINGGALVVGDGVEFDFTSGGKTWIVRDRLMDDGSGGQISAPGILDLGSRHITFNANSIVIEGDNASFDVARHISSNAGSLTIARGHDYQTLASRFVNHAGATLSLVGGRFLPTDSENPVDIPVTNLGRLVVDDQSHLRASELRLLAGEAELDGVIEADTIVGPGATLRGDGLFAYDLTLMSGSTLEVEFAGPNVMFDAHVDGALSILFPEDYAAPDEQGESITYLLLKADSLFGEFDTVSLDGNLLAADFGLGDTAVEDTGGGLTRTIRFLSDEIELVETLGPPSALVPEPSAAALAILAALFTATGRRRRTPAATQRVAGAPRPVIHSESIQPRTLQFHLVVLGALTALAAPAAAVTFDWDRGGGDNLWSNQANWNPESSIPGSADILILSGAAVPGPNTIDLGGVEREIVRIETDDGGLVDGGFTFENGTLEIFLTGGNALLTRNDGGPLVVNADVLFAPVNLDPRFNVEPSAPPIVVTGNVTSTAPESTRTVILELTSRNLALDPSVEVSGVISEAPGSKLGLRAGFEADSENHRGVVRVSALNTFTGATTVNGAVLEFNSIADADGTPSALGAPVGAVDGRITLGAFDGTNNVRSPGTLRYTGAGHRSNRELQLASDGAGAVVEASGTGALALSGDVTVQSSSVNQTLTLGGDYLGDNTLSGVIGANAGNGSLDLVKSGAGAWLLTGANLYEGETTVAEGSLTVLGGSIATAERATIGGADHALLNVLVGANVTTGQLRIADDAADSGAVNVEGPGSTLTVATSVAYVGYNGFGQLGITDGGSVVTLDNLTMGNGIDAVGIVNVDGVGDGGLPSTLSIAEALRVGDDGNGTINVTGGAKMITSADGDFRAYIGNETGGNGSVIVSGPGSEWNHQAPTDEIAVGNSGSFAPARARLDVLDGGSVTTHDLTVGRSKEGLAAIGGADSAIDVSGFLIIGRSGKGSLVVQSGGSLMATEGVDLGQNDEGDGRVLLTGPTSTFSTDGSLTVGRDGAGEFTVSDGATATVAGMLIAADSGGSQGTVNVRGATVDVADTVTIGLGPLANGLVGEAHLTVTGGGSLNMNNAAGSVDIGAVNTVRGHVVVGDSDLTISTSTLKSAGTLQLAPNGTNSSGASLTVRPTGLVDVAGIATIGGGPEGAVLFLEGGTIQADAFNIANSLNVQFNTGMIRVLGDQTLNAATIAEFGFNDNDGNPGTTGDPIILADQHLDIDGVATLSGPLVIDGGTLSVGSVGGNDLSQLAPLFGPSTMRTGALNLTNTALTIGANGMLGDALAIADDQTLDVAQAITFGAGGSLSIEGGTLGVGTLDLTGATGFSFSAGTLQFATVVGSVTVDGGTLSPGRRIGTATLVGDYTQNAGVLQIEIGGPNSGDFDRLTVTGTAAVNETLTIQSTADYRGPDERGEEHVFDILAASSITGAFDAIAYDGEELVAGVNYVPQPDPQGVDGLFRTLAVTDANVTVANYLAHLGDADGNRLVDGDDRQDWESNFGAAADFTTGDFDNDGFARGGDFLDWQANLGTGNPTTAVAASTAVPEPATALLLLSACGFAGRRKI